MRRKIRNKNHHGHGQKIKIRLRGRPRKVRVRYLVVALAIMGTGMVPIVQTRAESCPDLRVVFARGSGGERWSDQNFSAFKAGIEEKLMTVSLNYEFIDLDYPAVGVGMNNLGVTAGAYFGAGESYEFGESVNTGVQNLTTMINGGSCPNTKYVIGGYSQGAMVISKSLKDLRPEKIIYAATFGDPKLYLPEGKGILPAACRGKNLSDYRMYVPDCQAYKGMLGAYIPYEPAAFAGKVGTWCNRRDIFCSSHFNVSDHTSYVAENLYEDASRVIFDKITKAYGLENRVSSPHDTAILIDSTGSMANMIDQYKAEALRLATETLESGGRVALFDYRDLDDPYDLVQHCNFEDCSLEAFQRELENIRADGGGDGPESLLSASFHAMKNLNWRQSSTKSLVILTDANFLSPDRDGMTFDEVVALSRRIDPVNFYIVTDAAYGDDYEELATKTDGRVVTNFEELSLLTDYIMERYDSLLRVEEDSSPAELPTIEIESVEKKSDTEMMVKFTNTGESAIVILNDKILGVTEGGEVTIGELRDMDSDVITLVPLGKDVRGEGVSVGIRGRGSTAGDGTSPVISGGGPIAGDAIGSASADVLKAPATGKH